MDLSDYLDAAKAARGIPSDNQLASAIGMKRASVSHFRQRRCLPCDETMARLAEIAGLDVGEALLRLNYWRARNGRARDAYKGLLRGAGVAIGAAAFAIGAAIAPMAPARAGLIERSDIRSMYIMERKRVRRRRARMATRSVITQPAFTTFPN